MQLQWTLPPARPKCVWQIAVQARNCFFIAGYFDTCELLQGSRCKHQQHGSVTSGYAESSYGLLQPQVPVLICLQARPLQATAKGKVIGLQLVT